MALISNRELRSALNTSQDKKVLEWLRKNKVRWTFDAKDRPITTEAELNRGLFGESSANNDAEAVDF